VGKQASKSILEREEEGLELVLAGRWRSKQRQTGAFWREKRDALREREERRGTEKDTPF
jgi:hypothetical protein